MAGIRSKRWCFILLGAILSSFLVVASICVPAETRLKQKGSSYKTGDVEFHHVMRALNFFYQKGRVGYKHVWPEMRFGWKIVLGSIIGFFGAACGSVGGVGGGGIFVPMLTLIIGFDAKSSTALSKCMITGAAAATVYYNLKLRHPTLELPIIDYDLALLFQPMLVLGISLGVALNVIFADWTITILLIILFIVTSSKAFFKGVETWKKETKLKKEATRHLEFVEDTTEEVEDKTPPGGPISAVRAEPNQSKKEKVSIVENVYWKELGLLVAVWLIILSLQIGKIPVAVGVTAYEAVSLYKGRRKIASMGEASTNWRVRQLVLYCAIGVLAGIVGGMLGLGGGFILGPLFLEMGVPPQVSSATATFAMTFSASMSVIEYYLLKRFPVPYALYFFAVAIVAAFVGQHVVRKLISILGRASLIIFILAFTIFVSALLLGGVGIARMIKKIERKEYMGFENICSYGA
ncbi:sulfite exporter TauE/SafE family protein 3 isoform X6 [Hevea brasiliensis]|uniref:sulfite exporter TauE/SafE family protein 3 isoform X6 n=1 Tax=Hevea brasiliensis TaxID=3981 RepID=UPI0025D75815|nr:sulfite exporter TauE/SafE family protein 3 isoform X6 [Hevea brasiliensis]